MVVINTIDGRTKIYIDGTEMPYIIYTAGTLVLTDFQYTYCVGDLMVEGQLIHLLEILTM